MNEEAREDEREYINTAHFITRIDSSKCEKICEHILEHTDDTIETTTDSESLTYSKILHLSSQTESYKLFSHKKPDEHSYIIREILATEETFLNLIRMLIDDYLTPLSNVMTSDEKKSTMRIDIDAVFKLHKLLYQKLFEACLCKRGRTARVCHVFSLMQKLFMKTYVDYFLCIQGISFVFNS